MHDLAFKKNHSVVVLVPMSGIAQVHKARGDALVIARSQINSDLKVVSIVYLFRHFPNCRSRHVYIRRVEVFKTEATFRELDQAIQSNGM